jgi:predicted DNA-binding protein (MmcQ/YjbR family)
MKEPKTALDPRMELLREYVMAKPAVEDSFPFGPEAMVFRVAGKIFAIMAWEENPVYISLKCDPERASELRELHPGIIPGYHLNKKHWNSVTPGHSVDMELVLELIDHSYDLVVASLPKKAREELENLE